MILFFKPEFFFLGSLEWQIYARNLEFLYSPSFLKIVIINSCLIIIPVLVSIAFLTLLERKFLGLVGLRFGPNKVSASGILQPLTDAFKLANKGINLLLNISFFFYYLSGFFMLFFSLFLWNIIFGINGPVCLKFGLLAFIVVLGLNSFNSIFSGWSTLSKYTLIGRIRTVAQLISYEASLYICLIFPIFIFSTFDLSSLLFCPFDYLLMVIPVSFYIWLPSLLAELNRTPFDFSEGERELVSGFNTDFGSSIFTLTFLSEYSNILFFSAFTYFFFFSIDFTFFLLIVLFIIWIRAVLPRFRFDKLILLCWKVFIPFLTILFLIFLMSTF